VGFDAPSSLELPDPAELLDPPDPFSVGLAVIGVVPPSPRIPGGSAC
jgi:hypothetical protein